MKKKRTTKFEIALICLNIILVVFVISRTTGFSCIRHIKNSICKISSDKRNVKALYNACHDINDPENTTFVQFAMTNKFQGKLVTFGPNHLLGTMHQISRSFDIRICTEINTPFQDEILIFTNATLAQILGSVMNANPTYEWRYANQTKTMYVYPKTNTVSLMRCNPISVTNALVKTIFNENDILGFGNEGITIWNGMKSFQSWTDETVSLELENTCFWQVLDAINAQHPDKKYWAILGEPDLTNRCSIYYYDPRIEKIIIP